ncbi:TPA: hypothetical protein L8O06_000263 [Klebsiella pneumoniae]|uniref:hypothetical protein n=1 Tax=Klebsiella pneumoniae complex TaxID=3390273 RepID=UPI000E3CECD9|nr:hypothetical protein [Klebsiella pneumoniae]HCA4368650.1 hypothetical protein [Klebsiella variicola subsp. variicola]HDU3709082.1 hypothetical protein [Klebsiella pneumoniae subsp. pneumoniae]MBQ5042965.1 hypothetical protein [Klebsiella pneumoniae]MDT9788788.1 hypothetical protein [Klebsiella pneumoniae]MDT9882656.1 hypothetical protein [Klebsiella pneumoniae]
MNRKQEKKEPQPVPQSANYLATQLYEERVRAANSVNEAAFKNNSVAEAVFRNSDWKLIFKK